MKAYFRQLRRKADHTPDGGVMTSGFQCGEQNDALSFHLFDLWDDAEQINAYCAFSWLRSGARIGVAVIFPEDFEQLQIAPIPDDVDLGDDPFIDRHYVIPCPDGKEELLSQLAEAATINRLIQPFCKLGKSPSLLPGVLLLTRAVGGEAD